ncbi:putative immunity protein [Tersicoccus sp. Bi-70]|uniref:putative immunity protein n=1 Tax=Tersicoccus sp. Bi-70 TaxID=1897634 RepID=UPI0009776511|nr:hypothetical protein [Tersicoccus sp. Bi-70]OMH35058.1 hypothetical protein BGP79_01615 [Tersicoccus sp. Bi-70]
MASIQTLSDADRRTIARWAAACAERVLPLVDVEPAALDQVHDAVTRTRAYSAGESTAAEKIAQRMIAVKAASRASTPAGAAAARSAAQASGVAHLAAHALGAAAYAVKAVSLAHPGSPEAEQAEIRWQLEHLTADERAVLRRLPALGADSSGPLGPGLLARGILGDVIRRIQAEVGSGDAVVE